MERTSQLPYPGLTKLSKTDTDLVEIGISKLKGLVLGDFNTIRKEGLTWHKFRKILIENYSNTPHMSNAMVSYSHLKQQDDESTSQYLIRTKVLLKCINHTSMLSQVSGKGLNNLALIQGLRDSHIR